MSSHTGMYCQYSKAHAGGALNIFLAAEIDLI